MSDNVGSQAMESELERRFSKEFELLVTDLFSNHLREEEFKLFFFKMDFPRRLLDDDHPRIAVLFYLKEQCIIKQWSKEPGQLVNMLKELKRADLATDKVQELVGKYSGLAHHCSSLSSDSRPPVQETAGPIPELPIQETHQPSVMSSLAQSQNTLQDNCSTVPVVSDEPQSCLRPNRSNRNKTSPERRHGMATMETLIEEQPDDELLANLISQCTTDDMDAKNATLSPTSPVKQKMLWDYLHSSEVKENYGKKTVDGIMADFREHYHSSSTGIQMTHPTLQYPPMDESTPGPMTYPQHAKVSRTPSNVSKSSDRSSGYYSARDSNPRLSQLSIPEDVDEPCSNDDDDGESMEPFTSGGVTCSPKHGYQKFDSEFRSRTSSLPSSRQRSAIRPSISTSSCSSVTSLTSEDSTDTTVAGSSCSLDQTSSESDKGSLESLAGQQNSTTRCSQKPSIKLHPLTENKLEISISGEMELSVRDVRRDIKDIEKNQACQRVHKSAPFPPTNEQLNIVQYEMRFIPTNFGKDFASLYVDLAEEFCRKREDCGVISVPAMDVSVTVHLASDASNCIAEIRETIKARDIDIGKEGDSHRSVIVTSFPQLVEVRKLKKLNKGDKMIIKVVMDHLC